MNEGVHLWMRYACTCACAVTVFVQCRYVLVNATGGYAGKSAPWGYSVTLILVVSVAGSRRAKRFHRHYTGYMH